LTSLRLDLATSKPRKSLTKPSRLSEHVTEPDFWRGFGHGFKTSFQRGFRNYYRIAFYSAMVGSFLAVRWLHHSSMRTVSVTDELKAAAIGGLIAALVVHLCRWIIRRVNLDRVA
jgi:hypothetical protein